MGHGLNPRIYTIRNYTEQGVGWDVDAAGHTILEDDANAWAESPIKANIMPFTGERRTSPGNTATAGVERIKADVFRYQGGWPDIVPADNARRLMPTRILYDDRWWEVQVKKDWTRGLLPYIYFEAELLPSVQISEGPDTDTALPSDQQVRW